MSLGAMAAWLWLTVGAFYLFAMLTHWIERPRINRELQRRQAFLDVWIERGCGKCDPIEEQWIARAVYQQKRWKAHHHVC